MDKTITKVLLVLEDKAFGLKVKTFLSVFYSIEIVSGIKQAKKLIQTNNYEIFIIDRYLSNESGQDLIVPIKNRFPISSIIMLTPDTEFESVNGSLSLGADDYIVKSDFCLQELMIRIPLARKNLSIKTEVHKTPNQISFELPSKSKELSLKSYKAFILAAEKIYLKRAVELMGDNIAQTANVLGLSRATIFNKFRGE